MNERIDNENKVVDLTESINKRRNQERKTTIGIYKDGRISNPDKERGITTKEAIEMSEAIQEKYEDMKDLLRDENTYRAERRKNYDMTNETLPLSSVDELDILLMEEDAKLLDDDVTTDNLLMILDSHLDKTRLQPPHRLLALSRELIRRFKNSGN